MLALAALFTFTCLGFFPHCSPHSSAPPSLPPFLPPLLPSSLCPDLPPSGPSRSLTREWQWWGTWSAQAAAALHPTHPQLSTPPFLSSPNPRTQSIHARIMLALAALFTFTCLGFFPHCSPHSSALPSLPRFLPPLLPSSLCPNPPPPVPAGRSHGSGSGGRGRGQNSTPLGWDGRVSGLSRLKQAAGQQRRGGDGQQQQQQQQGKQSSRSGVAVAADKECTGSSCSPPNPPTAKYPALALFSQPSHSVAFHAMLAPFITLPLSLLSVTPMRPPSPKQVAHTGVAVAGDMELSLPSFGLQPLLTPLHSLVFLLLHASLVSPCSISSQSAPAAEAHAGGLRGVTPSRACGLLAADTCPACWLRGGAWGQHRRFPSPSPGGLAGTHGDGKEAALQQTDAGAARESIGVGLAPSRSLGVKRRLQLRKQSSRLAAAVAAAEAAATAAVAAAGVGGLGAG
ncbi:unnamed protein product [Closterium sp. NIES-65]|nr:unnamed protein product [Closterium sp. NIES-65]